MKLHHHHHCFCEVHWSFPFNSVEPWRLFGEVSPSGWFLSGFAFLTFKSSVWPDTAARPDWPCWSCHSMSLLQKPFCITQNQKPRPCQLLPNTPSAMPKCKQYQSQSDATSLQTILWQSCGGFWTNSHCRLILSSKSTSLTQFFFFFTIMRQTSSAQAPYRLTSICGHFPPPC